MLVKQDGTIDNEVTDVIFTNGRRVAAYDDQFLQITQTGKRLELWEGKRDFIDNKFYGKLRRVCYWRMRTVAVLF